MPIRFFEKDPPGEVRGYITLTNRPFIPSKPKRVSGVAGPVSVVLREPKKDPVSVISEAFRLTDGADPVCVMLADEDRIPGSALLCALSGALFGMEDEPEVFVRAPRGSVAVPFEEPFRAAPKEARKRAARKNGDRRENDRPRKRQGGARRQHLARRRGNSPCAGAAGI